METDKSDLHSKDGTNNVERRVSNVELVAVAASEQEGQGVQGDQVDDEHVTTPSADHVEVGQRADDGPVQRTSIHRLDPSVEGQNQRKNGDTFVIEWTGNWTRDVACTSQIHHVSNAPYEALARRRGVPGTIAIMAAPIRPALGESLTSLVKKYVTNEVFEANQGANKTQTLRICTVKLRACKIQYTAAAVSIKPGDCKYKAWGDVWLEMSFKFPYLIRKGTLT